MNLVARVVAFLRGQGPQSAFTQFRVPGLDVVHVCVHDALDEHREALARRYGAVSPILRWNLAFSRGIDDADIRVSQINCGVLGPITGS